ncbi:MAG: DMT family transporter [Pararhodobacter sp.]
MPSPFSLLLRLPAGLVGPLAGLLAFALYSTHDAVVKHLGASYSVFQILFFSALLSFPLAVVMLLRDPVPGTLLPRHPGWSLVRTVFMVTGWASVFYAFSVLPLAQTYAILFSTPLMITLLAIPVLGERVGWHRGLAVAVGMAGVLVVLRPGGTELSPGHAAALLAALCSAMSSVVVRRIGRDERAAVLMLYPMVAAVLVMGALLPLVYVPVELADLGAMAVVAVLAFAAALLIIAAYRRAEASVVAPMQYSQMIWATILGWLFFSESPDAWTIAGAALIIASGLYILFREGRANVSANQPVLGTGGRIATATAPEGPRPEQGAQEG